MRSSTRTSLPRSCSLVACLAIAWLVSMAPGAAAGGDSCSWFGIGEPASAAVTAAIAAVAPGQVPLVFSSDPPGARVTCLAPRARRGLVGVTSPPFVVGVAPGSYRYEFTHPECRTHVVEVEATGPRPRSVGVLLERWPAALVVDLLPSDANLTVDGRPVARAELPRLRLTAGPHRVVAAGPGYVAQTCDVVLSKESETRLVLRLQMTVRGTEPLRRVPLTAYGVAFPHERLPLKTVKDKLNVHGSPYSDYNPRSAVLLGRKVVLGDRDSEHALIYELTPSSSGQSVTTYPVAILDLPGSQALVRVRVGGRDMVVTARGRLFELSRDGLELGFVDRTRAGPTQGSFDWLARIENDVPDSTRFVGTSGGAVWLFDPFDEKFDSRRLEVSASATQALLLGDRLWVAERAGVGAARFAVWDLGKTPPRRLAVGDTVDGACYHLVSVHGRVVAGMEFQRRDRKGSRLDRALLALAVGAGQTVTVAFRQENVPVRTLAVAGDLLITNGLLLRVSPASFADAGSFAGIGQPDGLPYFADVREGMLVLPGNDESAIVRPLPLR